MFYYKALLKKQIQDIRKLKKHSERIERKEFMVEGLRGVEQVIENGFPNILFIVMEQSCYNTLEQFAKAIGKEKKVKKDDLWKGLRGAPFFTLWEYLMGRPNRDLYVVSSGVFKSLSDTQTPQGVMAVCRMPAPVTISESLAGQGAILACDRIQDPGNMGTLIRTALWFGFSGLWVSPGSVDIFHPKVVRSSAGATGILPWMEANLDESLIMAQNNGWNVYLLDADPNALSFRDATPSGKDILVAGNEANGISRLLKEGGYPVITVNPSDKRPLPSRNNVQIENLSTPAIESLNVSVAASIVMAQFAQF